MSEFYGGDYIGNVLANTSAITAIVGTDIYNARLLPKVRPTTGVAVGLETINYYLVTPAGGAMEIPTSIWSIDCRSESEAVSQNLANEVKTVLNRVNGTYTGNKYFGIIDVGQTLPPADSADVYMTPVSFTVRRH